jgi:SAM-dependent methyltransferase
MHRLPAGVTAVYGVEPNGVFAEDIAATRARCGLEDKYTLVRAGIEDSDVLERHGIVEGSVDTVLCIQVLCSVDDPELVMRQVWKLLRPGGRFIFWEHGRSGDFWTRAVQGTLAYSVGGFSLAL